MPKRLQSSAILITGGAVRLGKAICETVASSGYAVVIHCRRSVKQANALADQINTAGGTAWVVRGSIDTEAGCRKVMTEAWRLSGGVSVLVNNASVYEVADAASSSWSLFSRLFSINLFGPACLSREFAKQVARRRNFRGSIVNILDERISGMDPASAVYTLSKKALADYTKMTALEFAPGVRVNAVAPGAILPPKGKGAAEHKGMFKNNPLKKKVSPNDVASAVLYLIEASAITGQILYVDGGRNVQK